MANQISMQQKETFHNPYLILKYYYYVPIKAPTLFREKHHEYCVAHDLRGRIKIAPEGINGTISGLVKDCEAYMKYLKAKPRFANIIFNITPSATHVHEKLNVRLKKEIVRADMPFAVDESNHQAGKEYIDAYTFEKMRHQKDVMIVDVRANHEHQLGKFEHAITFDIDDFRSFFKKTTPEVFDKSKRYIVICTRGIKSVKGWHYLKQVHQLPHVHYLQGGILDYAQKTDGRGFEGVCYVFDQRVAVPINQKNPTIISSCHLCKAPSSRMVNCANPTCNTQLTTCETCSEKWSGGCSAACAQHPRKRPYNSKGYYAKQPNGYNPYIGLHRHMTTV